MKLIKNSRNRLPVFLILSLSIILLGGGLGCTKTNKAANSLQQAIPLNIPMNQIPGVVNPYGTGNPVLDSEIAKLYPQVPCKTTGERYNYEFSTVNSYHSGITGPYATGTSPGIASEAYVGLSYFGDILIVKKVTNGAQVAYNLTFSMCRFDPLIVPGRPMTQLLETSIVLHKGSCPLNEVSSAKVVMIAAPIAQSYGLTLPESQVPTTFAPADILGIKLCNTNSF